MRHVYECQMRWADMDQLGHVNNVTYVDYLQEARIDLLATHAPVPGGEELAEGVVVFRNEVEFLAPLVYRPAPVRIECWVSEVRAASFTMGYEIVGEQDGERVVHVRASSVLAPFVFAEERPRRITAEEKAALAAVRDEPATTPVPIGPRREGTPVHEFPLSVRWSDVDAYNHVNNVQYFEFFQEARIGYVGRMADQAEGAWSKWAVARVDVQYRRPILFRSTPYGVRTWIDHVGNSSLVLRSEITDPGTDDAALAQSRAVLVAFDPATQRATAMAPGQRDRLLAELG